MGSGHILVYAFDMLMQIYTSAGWDQREAAQSILKNNLFGLDIDDRAAQLAYFAVMMKARQYDRRLLTRGIQPNIYSIRESNGIQAMTIEYFHKNDPKLKADIESIVTEMRDAKEYGSVLNITSVDFAGLYARFDEIRNDINMMQMSALDELLPLVKCAEVLAQKYDVVVTNPPYMAVSNAGAKVNDYVKKNFPDSKADMFAVFIERCGQMAKKNGYQAMITQHTWMFLSSYEKMRMNLLSHRVLVNMAHLGARAFDEINGEVVQTTSFVCRNIINRNYAGTYIRLISGDSETQKRTLFLHHDAGNTFYMSNEVISQVPNSLIAYWLSPVLINHLVEDKKMKDYGEAKQGLITSDNDRFLRLWHEIEQRKIGCKWFLYNKGGGFRRWYGNIIYVVNWENDGFEICHFVDDKGNLKSRPQNIQYFFRKGLTWNDVSTAKFCCRYVDGSCAFDASGPTFFLNNDENEFFFLGLLNSNIVQEFMDLICQGLHYSTGHIPQIPVCISDVKQVNSLVVDNIQLCKEDWDSFETSPNFQRQPLI